MENISGKVTETQPQQDNDRMGILRNQIQLETVIINDEENRPPEEHMTSLSVSAEPVCYPSEQAPMEEMNEAVTTPEDFRKAAKESLSKKSTPYSATQPCASPSISS